ncbi:hypothetical protein M011DRAFT_128070 [Sporormia fimetaria CBS 119925]|uniref:DUF7587 domain-containing protein n=1 Tax=Sporormia fimetaria CBS 119925 TaxID=1340428 RepID=A0A6A6V8A4_9PLEO|nr:hypothetical protein M011DRAFT_128070 [Sporormia fimetaria CBS 119925]
MGYLAYTLPSPASPTSYISSAFPISPTFAYPPTPTSPTFAYSPTSTSPTTVSSYSRTTTAQTPSPPSCLPPYVYRLHFPTSQTKYPDETGGFRSKNQSTHPQRLDRARTFATAHLKGQTNVSSPFVSVFDNLNHAKTMALSYAQHLDMEITLVTIDTTRLARGPIFRAQDVLRPSDAGWDHPMHKGEYLLLHRVPGHACVEEMYVGRVRANNLGAIGPLARKASEDEEMGEELDMEVAGERVGKWFDEVM